MRKDLAVNKLRGLVFYNTRLSDQKNFEYLGDQDEEKEMMFPPMIILLTSSGELAKYAFIDKRTEFAKDDLLVNATGASSLNRELNVSGSSGQPHAEPQLRQSGSQETVPPKVEAPIAPSGKANYIRTKSVKAKRHLVLSKDKHN